MCMAVHINFMVCFKMNILQIILACVFTYILAAPQQSGINFNNAAEIPDQYDKHPEGNQLHKTVNDLDHDTTANPDISPDTTATIPVEIHQGTTPKQENKVIVETTTQLPFTTKLYSIVALPIKRFFALPKVNIVLRNIGTCIVNGAMEIIAHFFPTPLMPLIASAAGMIIPFEPIVLLKERMPVTSYRRAIKTAVNSFMGTFDKYKLEDQYDDPYMARRFNRRFMNDNTNIEKIKRANDT